MAAHSISRALDTRELNIYINVNVLSQKPIIQVQRFHSKLCYFRDTGTFNVIDTFKESKFMKVQFCLLHRPSFPKMFFKMIMLLFHLF